MTRSLPRFFIHATVAVLVLAGAAAFIASRSDAESPPPEKPLAQAVQEALTAPAPAGVSGRIEFSNRLVDADAVPRGADNPLLAGAEGRFWIARDGHARLALESPAGDAQIELDGDRVVLYEPASNTVYEGEVRMPDLGEQAGHGPAGMQQMLRRFTRAFALSDAEPGTVAGQAAYTVRISPRHDGGLLGAAEVAWDAAHGVPLRGAVYAQGEQEPVLEVEATDVDFGRGGGVRRRDPAARGRARRRAPERRRGSRTAAPGGWASARRRTRCRRSSPFELAAPAAVAGLPRRSIRTLRSGGDVGALVTYGKGLGALLVVQTAGARRRPAGRARPAAAVDRRRDRLRAGDRARHARPVRARRRLLHGHRLGAAGRGRSGGAGALIRAAASPAAACAAPRGQRCSGANSM